MKAVACLVVLMSAALWACGDEEAEAELGGSVSTLGYSLAYDSTRIRLLGGQLAIQYLDGRQIPVQVIIDVESAGLTGPMTVQLPDHGDVVGDRENASLPDLVRGQVNLDTLALSPGAEVTGRFDATVESSGREYTIYGSFNGALEVP